MSQSIERVFITRAEAADLLSMSGNYLAKLCCQRRGPRVSKFGAAACSPVRYAVRDILDWASDPVAHERRVWGSTVRKGHIRRQKAGRK